MTNPPAPADPGAALFDLVARIIGQPDLDLLHVTRHADGTIVATFTGVIYELDPSQIAEQLAAEALATVRAQLAPAPAGKAKK